ncbi:MAG: hypothetical protein SGJ27_05055 [Candidatus Melainabacteria bacterium]|nr:hypothetical protein [Candidatus Melainabacteria bacterium]
MQPPRSKLSAIFAGSTAGLLAVLILLVVPILGVRKAPNLIATNWQEMVLYASCLLAGTIAGARIGLLEMHRARSTDAWHYGDAGTRAELEANFKVEAETNDEANAKANAKADGDGEANANSEARAIANAEASAEAAPPGSNDTMSELPAPSDSKQGVLEHVDDEPPSTVPQIELSLAGGPKKPSFRFWTEQSKSRTRVLLLFLYLLLFVMCAVLCQKMILGSIVTDFLTAEMIRNLGVGLSVTGLYLMVRGMFVRSAPTKSSLVETETSDLKVGGWTPHLSPHVPPTRLAFLRAHPVCAGWLVLLTGLPLVFLAWFPLIAIPGLFIAMNWLFVERNPTSRDIASFDAV